MKNIDDGPIFEKKLKLNRREDIKDESKVKKDKKVKNNARINQMYCFKNCEKNKN